MGIISCCTCGTALGMSFGDCFGERIGDTAVELAGLSGERRQRAREILKNRMILAGSAGGGVWGGLLGAEIETNRRTMF